MKPAEGSTVIGRSVTIRGELTGNEDLFMDGDIEGTITLPGSRLTIGPNARILADIHGLDITVFGAVTGNIHAAGRLELRQSASVTGDIFASRLSIEESAFIKGSVELKTAETSSAQVSTVPEGKIQETLVLEPKA
ncbi:MAG TPA: polymer-forming cytoskeletal protein [Edaphobacter sp.]|nr:polymer-forming cytoskeletal protein [Edaphobacter sp.]